MLVVPGGSYPGGSRSNGQLRFDAADDAVLTMIYDLVNLGVKHGLENRLPYALDVGRLYAKYSRPFLSVSAVGQDPLIPLLGGRVCIGGPGKGLSDVGLWYGARHRASRLPVDPETSCGAAAFVMGTRAVGTMIGEWPGLAAGLDALDNVKTSSDFRGLYCSVLEQWLGYEVGPRGAPLDRAAALTA